MGGAVLCSPWLRVGCGEKVQGAGPVPGVRCKAGHGAPCSLCSRMGTRAGGACCVPRSCEVALKELGALGPAGMPVEHGGSSAQAVSRREAPGTHGRGGGGGLKPMKPA